MYSLQLEFWIVSQQTMNARIAGTMTRSGQEVASSVPSDSAKLDLKGLIWGIGPVWGHVTAFTSAISESALQYFSAQRVISGKPAWRGLLTMLSSIYTCSVQGMFRCSGLIVTFATVQDSQSLSVAHWLGILRLRVMSCVHL